MEEKKLLLPIHAQDFPKNNLKSQGKRVEYFSINAILSIFFLISSVIVLSIWASKIGIFTNSSDSAAVPRKRNVIFMVSDGFGPASETFARDFYQHVVNGNHQLPPWDSDGYPKLLPLDTLLVGQSRTRSADSWVTDSAAGATAFSCGLKSYNGAIAVNSSRAPCVTVMEAAKEAGYMTAIVVTSTITHATPGSFSAHTTWRNYEDLIATHQLGENPFGRVVDLMFGGGRSFFLPKSDPESLRNDERDLLNEATEKFGFRKVITTRQQFDELSGGKDDLPLIGLFKDEHMSYEIDRDPSKEPALWEMTQEALNIMTDSTKSSDKGFMMVVEGSRIDMAAHDNDPGSHAHEILSYQKTIEIVKKYVDEHPGTIMISVSDHETGGLSLGRQLTGDYPNYEWNPEVVLRQKNSTEIHASLILETPLVDRPDFVRHVLTQHAGIEDYTEQDVMYLSNSGRSLNNIKWYLGDMISKRALLGWATHGHSGVDVNLYAYAGKKFSFLIDDLRRNLENIELEWFMESYLGLSKKLFGKMHKKLIQEWESGRFKTWPDGKSPVPNRSMELQMEEDEKVRDNVHYMI